MARLLARSRVLALLATIPAVGVGLPSRAQTPKLRMAAIAAETGGEPLYLLDGGFFSKFGIDVEMNLFTSGGQITNALAGGALDVGIADPIQVGNAFNRGLPFGYFAGGVEYSTDAATTQLCVAKNGPIKSAKDLDGQTIGVYGLGSMPEFSAKEWLRSNGVDVARLKFVEIPPAALDAAIGRGTVAAGMVGEPWLSFTGDTELVALGKAFDACAKRFYVNGWFANRDWLAKNPGTVRSLVSSIYAGARWANTHHAETAQILAKYGKVDVARIQRMIRAAFDTALDPKKLQPPLDIAWKYHGIERPLTAAQLIVKA